MRPDLPASSRALLTPGPLPPGSHLGVTLLRHAVATGLRYALYQLGLPLPEAPPVRVVRLRLYLDRAKLETILEGAPGGLEVAAALLDPGGAGSLSRARGGSGRPAGRLTAAAAFHRARLRLSRSAAARLPKTSQPIPGDAPWPAFQATLSRLLPRTSEALLGDLLAALDRRARRARGEIVPPVPGRGAADLLAGRNAPLDRLGIPDPLAASWAGQPAMAERLRRAMEASAPALVGPSPGTSFRGTDRLRGSFRETWRAALDRLAPLLAAHAAAAVARGHLAQEEDIYFIALDLQEDLNRPERPRWVEGAVRDNRAEREALLAAPEPAERLFTGLEVAEPVWADGWALGPLLPLP